MKRVRNLYVVTIFTGLVIAFGAFGCGQAAPEPEEGEMAAAGVSEGGVQAPMFEVDPLWPKPLPNHWVMGSTIGVSVDSQDHVWVIHREASLNERTEIAALADPPRQRVLFPGPARPRVGSGG